MFDPGPCVYMEKLVGGPTLQGVLSLTDPIEDVLYAVARRRGVTLGDLMVVVLDRPRHAEMITRIRDAGVRIRLISDGDVSGALLAAMPDTGIDLLWGIGGTPEGVLSAAAIRCVGGTMLGRLWPRDDGEAQQRPRRRLRPRAHPDDRGPRRAARTASSRPPGVTDGDLVRGVRFDATGATTHSLVMRGRSGTIRQVDAPPPPGQAARAHGRQVRMIAPVERAMAVEVDQRVRIAAPPERVWRALTDVDDLRRWLFESADADVREGGSWRFTFPHWPSARGLHHPALNFGGPIVELVPGRVLAVQFEPPYWGVLRFEVSPDGDGTDLRVTQRGFEGNEEWLADFRGGWGSFSDRLALLCELGEVATARRLEARTWRARSSPASLPARSPRWVDGSHAPTGTARPGGSRSYSLASSRPPATSHAGRSLRRALREPPARRGYRSRAREPRALAATPRLDGGRPAARRRSTRQPATSSALPYRPALDLGDPEPFVRAFERSFCAPGRAAAPAYFAPRGALALAGGPHPRPLDTPLSRLPEQAVARFWRLRLDGDGVLTADWEGSGWTAGRNRGTSTWTFGGDGRIERLILRFDPAVPRMVAA